MGFFLTWYNIEWFIEKKDRNFQNFDMFSIYLTFDEMKKKITNSNKSHKSYRKYKWNNEHSRTSEYIRRGIRCHKHPLLIDNIHNGPYFQIR
jgi:hypothetical protein